MGIALPFQQLNKESVLDIKLTPGEVRVSDLLLMGLSYKEIALVLGISVSGVRWHTRNIFKKYKLKSRYQYAYKVLSIRK